MTDVRLCLLLLLQCVNNEMLLTTYVDGTGPCFSTLGPWHVDTPDPRIKIHMIGNTTHSRDIILYTTLALTRDKNGHRSSYTCCWSFTVGVFISMHRSALCHICTSQIVCALVLDV